MSAYKFTSHRQLRDVLNNVENRQKVNIKEYSSGHLNERNLYKPPANKGNKTIWKSSKSKKKPLSDSDLVPEIQQPGFNLAASSDKHNEMKDVLYQFSIGTAGNVPAPSPVKSLSPSPRRLDKVEEFRKQATDLSKVTEEGSNIARHESRTRGSGGTNKSLYSLIDDGILVEELPNLEMMVKSPRMSRPFMPKKLLPLDETSDTMMTDFTQTLDADGFLTLKHTFLPSFTSGVTKSDQFNKLRRFEDSVLRMQDCREKKVLSGVKAVEHLERRLEADLESMNLSNGGPNFHKLQVYSNNFEDLIDETPTFGYMLKCIKSEYDNYITKLLDSQTPQHSRLLRDQVQQMSTRGTSRPKELEDAKQRVADLEVEARAMLADNERLRAQVKEEEEWLANAPEPGLSRKLPKAEVGPAEPTEDKFHAVGVFEKRLEMLKLLAQVTGKAASMVETEEQPTIPVVSIFVDDTPIELADEIEHVKALILEKLDALNALRHKLTQEYVPLTVCTHLEQCIKETEIEVQKLLKQNEYYERSNDEMETELKDSIQNADTSERDARRIWKKVNSLKGLPRVTPVSNSSSSTTQEDSDDEEDDETKWNWYIS